MEIETYRLGINEFAGQLGVAGAELSAEVQALIQDSDLSYRPLSPEERDRLVIRIIRQIDSGRLSVSGPAGKDRWQKGWQENLDNFLNKEHDLDQLVPKFIRPDQPIRLLGDYVMPLDPQFELRWYEIFRLWLATSFLKDADVIFEFGCGSGHNIAMLADLFPEKEIVGLDWVKPSCDIVDEIAKLRNTSRIRSHLFDMFHPDPNLKVPGNSTFLAIGALEQLGGEYQPFLSFVLEKKPKRFVHVDSIIELYDSENNLSDYLAVKFDLKRNYLNNYLNSLRDLEKQKQITITHARRTSFGSLFHDGYSYLVWNPVTL
ncbi:MAG: class I SAM-dependent methyltransferase [Candidatus Omnitrophica bacterium]|nr:class I SAM-dependent methyltransferase [Candidatus Omnitrophota bacterium]